MLAVYVWYILFIVTQIEPAHTQPIELSSSASCICMIYLICYYNLDRTVLSQMPNLEPMHIRAYAGADICIYAYLHIYIYIWQMRKGKTQREEERRLKNGLPYLSLSVRDSQMSLSYCVVPILISKCRFSHDRYKKNRQQMHKQKIQPAAPSSLGVW